MDWKLCARVACVESEKLLCSGSGRVSQALEILPAFNGQSLMQKPFQLLPAILVSGQRIGISKAGVLPWRFGLAGSCYLSKPLR